MIKKIILYLMLLLSTPVVFAQSINNGGGGGGGGGGSTFTNTTPTPVTLGGIPAGSTFSSRTLQQMFDALLYPYIAPAITLSSTPAGGANEIGVSIASVDLSALTVEHTNPISGVTFYRGASLIHTVPSPSPTGGTELYTDSSAPVTTNTTYTARVTDGTATTVSNSVTFSFLPGIYHGVSNTTTTTGAGVMSKFSASRVLSGSCNVTYVFDASTGTPPNYLVVARPSTCGVPTSVTFNGFAFTDYTLTTSSLTNASGYTQNYQILQTNNTYSGAGITLEIQ